MGGSPSTQIKIPMNENEPVWIKEVERLSNEIETMIKQRSNEKALLKSKYGVMNPDSIKLDSCETTLKFYGNHAQTFGILQNRFKDKTRYFELTTKYYSDDDDYNYGCPPVFLETSVIKIIV